jgi:hypothetical protein
MASCMQLRPRRRSHKRQAETWSQERAGRPAGESRPAFSHNALRRQLPARSPLKAEGAERVGPQAGSNDRDAPTASCAAEPQA